MRRTAITIVFALVAASAGAAQSVLPFIPDDYARAAAEARAKNVPIFVDAWAPW